MQSHATFSPEYFCQIVERALAAGYRFCRFDRPSDGRRLWLRHDVDISPRMALRLGQIAAELKVSSNLFFQLNTETYSLFVPETLDIITALRGMGHCVGLHVDERLIGNDTGKISDTIKWFSENVVEIDTAVSFHRPTEAVLGRQFDAFVNAYGPPFFDQARYLSDSRRSLDFAPRYLDLVSRKVPDIQLLLHPEWWHSVSSPEEFWDLLRRRRQRQLERYALANFKKVFSGIIAENDSEEALL